MISPDEIRRSVDRVDDERITLAVDAFENILAFFFPEEIRFRQKFMYESSQEFSTFFVGG